jgi:hypothetical protein
MTKVNKKRQFNSTTSNEKTPENPSILKMTLTLDLAVQKNKERIGNFTIQLSLNNKSQLPMK